MFKLRTLRTKNTQHCVYKKYIIKVGGLCSTIFSYILDFHNFGSKVPILWEMSIPAYKGLLGSVVSL